MTTRQPDKSSKKRLTVETVASFLLKRRLITQERYTDIVARGEELILRLQQLNEAGGAKNSSQGIGVITPAEAIAALELEIPGAKGKLLNEDTITEVIATETGIPYKKLDPIKLALDVVTGHIPRPFALRHMIVPVENTAGVITLAVIDPYDMEAVESLKHAKNLKTRLVLSSKTDVLRIVREFFGFHSSIAAAQAEMQPGVDLGNLEQFVKLKGQGEIEATDSHIVRAVTYLFQYAFEQRASDIHIEPKREKSIVRLRIDGILHTVHSTPKAVHAPITSRIKMLSRMDITEKRRPQDGRIKTNHKDKELELRVSTLPTAFGEKIVIRIFDPDMLMQDIEKLGFYPREYKLYDSFIKRPNGIILVTGPTGSGKTTTLYSSLRVLSSPEINIVTIEEPIEMVIEEFNQVSVQQSIGVTFATMLRTILRQDPDIIMVGEIRDKETADNAIQSALTGHLVLSTLHTNDSPSSITRLLDLGIQSFLICSTLIGVIAQRLVRKICIHCKRQRVLTEDEAGYLQLDKNTTHTISYGEGCIECRGTGYRGRTAIFEVMEFTERVRRTLSDNADLNAIYSAAAADGMITLRQAAIRKMLEGITTYEEVIFMT
ncbi:GspE/PulE family protein [Candidatus Magnetominusculus xianensis]|uniref:Type II secretion system protein E n=1 Tax=Candidatus Magnetominusculus xianensis TaxID=1748249 RepID=A0ABR5SBT7_9BACT|nr:GspE/PulE family protein [Candidatus Magnetominusculus xianensis]KWT78281.1 type II secretion system protein E [Candidatus Magnetominusculus xianensis]MBF0404030.1 Flp pilus assembly complex ATPase component TadA [Nitrospirota bacterium]